MGAIEEAWLGVDRAASDVAGIAKRVAVLGPKLTAASSSGGVSATGRALDALSEELKSMSVAVEHARSALAAVEAEVTEPNVLAREVESDLRSRMPDRRVWRSMSEVVAFPVVANLKPAKVTVDKHSLNTQRPGVIIGIITEVLKGGSTPERFLRALHIAFQLVNGGRIAGQAPLGQLHQVLAASPPGGGAYSQSDFRVDLQWLYASDVRSVGDVAVRFDVASAGPEAIPVFDGEGNLVNLGYVSFVEGARSDG